MKRHIAKYLFNYPFFSRQILLWLICVSVYLIFQINLIILKGYPRNHCFGWQTIKTECKLCAYVTPYMVILMQILYNLV